MNVLEKRDKIIELYGDSICDICLGRQFTQLYMGKENGRIGSVLRQVKTEDQIEALLAEDHDLQTGDYCKLCNGIFAHMNDVDSLYGKLLKKAKAYEYNNFLIGTVIPQELQDEEEKLWEKAGIEETEPLKKELNRVIGKKFAQETGKIAEFEAPDINFIVDFRSNGVDVSVNSLFIKGRYTKHVRGIPQTKWPCRTCNGSGCKKCDFTGKQYQESVEELVAKVPLLKFEAMGESYHGQGREDIDALMLGEGRPFILELKKPRLRFTDLKKLEEEINASTDKVQVKNLEYSTKKEVRELKAEPSDKTYQVIIKVEGKITNDELEKLTAEFENKKLDQRTPVRVAHRRADKVRQRKIYYVKPELIDESTFKAEIKTEAGTYVKELISGDEGRTKPSFSAFLGKQCKCEELNVAEVHDDKKNEKE
ncbi:MAG: tRNA pseudouridine(54/55) synthase Pus10 [DPANN group archaeon]|nr:tRNA pseudouridine(54/55) synthase Pus10 [DPANN group archaeon]